MEDVLYTKQQSLAYVVGIALGDGNLSNPNGRAVRLRVTCDAKYPVLLNKIMRHIQLVRPGNKVSLVDRKTCVDVSCYSNAWEDILGWKVGSKFSQNASVPAWIFQSKDFIIPCLCGLIESDGSVYKDRGYQMVFFTNVVYRLAKDVCAMFQQLGFEPKFYTVVPPKDRYQYDGKVVYNVRLSKNVNSFLNLVQPQKC
jgi:hypothetical protein